MERLLLLLRYIRHFFSAGDAHSIHSPFVFEFYNNVIISKKHYYTFDEIEKLRTQLLQAEESINVTDYGAGSKTNHSGQRKLKSIVATAEKNQHIAQVLFRTIVNFRPQYIIDLGTSLGLTTIYFSKANSEAKIYTFEGCPETAKHALKNFKELHCKNITQVSGNIDDTLSITLKNIPQVDFVFFDANHRFQPTMNYFKQCLGKKHEDSVFVFDDIHWSTEMEQAWEAIKKHEEVTLSIDLFFIGFVFFRKKQPKQHFTLKL